MQFSSGSIQKYVKSLELQQKWTIKKNDLYTMREDSLRAIGAPSEEKPNTMRLQFITQQLQTGKKLGGADMEYLRKHNPELYAKAQSIQAEREDYERALRRCRSKEEARLLHVGRVSSVMSGSGVGGASAHGEVTAGEGLMRLSAFNSEYDSFCRTVRYKKLPDFPKRSNIRQRLV
jgi:hypothetical protein